MDYAIPRADQLPAFASELDESEAVHAQFPRRQGLRGIGTIRALLAPALLVYTWVRRDGAARWHGAAHARRRRAPVPGRRRDDVAILRQNFPDRVSATNGRVSIYECDWVRTVPGVKRARMVLRRA
jgi:hypothetical protein